MFFCARMNHELFHEIKTTLPKSDSRIRKQWAEQIIREKIPLSEFLVLLHGEKKTAQRFIWLIGDLLELDSNVVVDCLPILFSLRDQMPFPGMRRTVAKCIWFADVPPEMEPETTKQLFSWLADEQYSIGCKHYAAKALFDLVKLGKVPATKLKRILAKQANHSNTAHAKRMGKMLSQVSKQL